MFEETQRMLRRLAETSKISVPISDDEEGYFDRECPSEVCLFQFKIHSSDWKERSDKEEVHCPSCGHTAGSEKWWTQQQIDHARAAAMAEITGDMQNSLKADADRFNRRQPRGGFISMTMKAKSRPTQVMLPPAAADPMQLKITCPACACRYAVIGAAYFCPACGHSAAEQVFQQSIDGIRATIGALDLVRAAISDKDTAENTVRLVLDNGLQNSVTVFQRVAEVLFAEVPSSTKVRRNAFQNLGEGSALWKQSFGKTYEDHLTANQLKILALSFQQRHLLAHRQGIVDEEYITKSGDDRYQVGQRIIVRANTVTETLDLVEKLVAGLEADISAVR